MPKIIIDDNKGLYQTSGKGVVGLTQSKTVNASWSSGANIQAAAITIPANSLITAAHAVVTSAVVGGAGNVQTTIGTTALGTEIAIAKNIAAAGATTAGKGHSTVSTLTTALSGNQSMVITAGEAFQTDEVDLYASVITSGGGALTAGAVQFTIEFVTFE